MATSPDLFGAIGQETSGTHWGIYANINRQ